MLENSDLQVLEKLIEWIQTRKKVWLATVTNTWGSSPRPIGSIFCCDENGTMVGSLSGGCIEEDLLERLTQKELLKDKPRIITYGKTQEESDRFGLPCGGKLEIVLEPQFDSTNLPEFLLIKEGIKQRQCMLKISDLSSGTISSEPEDRYSSLSFSDGSKTILKHTLGPRFQMFLIGAGQVSQYLAQIAKMLDYHVLVCDPRQEIIDQWGVEGVQLICDMPDDAIRAHIKDKLSAIVALTHDPRIDDMGLMEALKTPAFFVGAMGSKRTSEKRKERLLQLELSENDIDKLHAPVGLPTGSKTPAEIAISIIAQINALRSKNANSLQPDFQEVRPLPN
ncbi:MAG: hypothetical protein CMQ40_11015 [Gammaproteobacteria bacterium]|nr:hypothetical protein [Gammaproteobacteria bacterium]